MCTDPDCEDCHPLQRIGTGTATATATGATVLTVSGRMFNDATTSTVHTIGSRPAPPVTSPEVRDCLSFFAAGGKAPLSEVPAAVVGASITAPLLAAAAVDEAATTATTTTTSAACPAGGIKEPPPPNCPGTAAPGATSTGDLPYLLPEWAQPASLIASVVPRCRACWAAVNADYSCLAEIWPHWRMALVVTYLVWMWLLYMSLGTDLADIRQQFLIGERAVDEMISSVLNSSLVAWALGATAFLVRGLYVIGMPALVRFRRFVETGRL